MFIENYAKISERQKIVAIYNIIVGIRQYQDRRQQQDTSKIVDSMKIKDTRKIVDSMKIEDS